MLHLGGPDRLGGARRVGRRRERERWEQVVAVSVPLEGPRRPHQRPDDVPVIDSVPVAPRPPGDRKLRLAAAEDLQALDTRFVRFVISTSGVCGMSSDPRSPGCVFESRASPTRWLRLKLLDNLAKT